MSDLAIKQLAMRNMRRNLAALAMAVFWPAIVYGQPPTPSVWDKVTWDKVTWDKVKGLIRAAYYSDACRAKAQSLGFTPRNTQLTPAQPEAAKTATAEALVAAFLEQRAAAPRGGDVDATHNPCAIPHVLLINVLRSQGVDGALVFASMKPADAAPAAAPPTIAAMLVFVDAINRYVDPAAPPEGQAPFDRMIRERAYRTHIIGPALDSSVPDACSRTCMAVVNPTNGVDSVRVRTERIPAR